MQQHWVPVTARILAQSRRQAFRQICAGLATTVIVLSALPRAEAPLLPPPTFTDAVEAREVVHEPVPLSEDMDVLREALRSMRPVVITGTVNMSPPSWGTID